MAGYAIPWAKPHFWGQEQAYLADALSSTWISGGAYVDRFEQEIAAAHGVPHAVAAANGTASLHLAYLAIGLDEGDEVVVPGFGFLAAANMALQMRATPVFADVDPQTWCLTAECVAPALSPRTRAVVPVHTYGNVCDMDPLIALCRSRGIVVIEDAAESFASRYKGRYSGSIGDIGCLSFQATKTITTGEGGMTITRRDDLADRMKLFRSHGMLKTRYMHEVAGFNYRLTNLQAALGCAQFEKLAEIAEARREMNRTYARHLARCDGITLQAFSSDVDPVVWVVAALLDRRAFPQGRDMVMQHLAERGIETRPGFYPPGAMRHLYPPSNVPVCENISASILCLPSYPTLAPEDIETICAALKSLRR